MIKTKRDNSLVLSQFYKSPKGFTLIEILIGIAIIGILSAVAIPQYNKYKIRGYDAHSKQALRDMLTLCNAYWLENNSSDGCELSLIKNITYGFNQNPEIVATLPPSPLDNFCGAAKHNSSPNTYSIDSASLISSGDNCSGAGGASPPGQSKESSTPAVCMTPEGNDYQCWNGMRWCLLTGPDRANSVNDQGRPQHGNDCRHCGYQSSTRDNPLCPK